MPKRIPEEAREEISRLYDDGRGASPAEIARQVGVSYASVYGMTRARQRVNPETGEKYKSQTEYKDYQARQRVNPETGEQFKSRTEYEKNLARQRKERRGNIELSDLIKTRLKELGKTQSWLAQQMGVSRQRVSHYANGVSIPQGEKLDKLLVALEIRDKPKSLDNLVE